MTEITGRECKFVLHIPKREGLREDTHMVKEIIHYTDGTTKPNIRFIENFKRPFYITKPHHQNHKQKKENEDLDKVNQYYSTQSDLPNTIAMRLGKIGYTRNVLRDVVDSPFLYGVDITSTAVIKRVYAEKYPEAISDAVVATLDIENNIDDKMITIITVAMKDKIYTAVLNSFVKGYRDVDQRLADMFEKYIPDIELKRKGIKRTIEFFDNELELIKGAINTAHEWKPDFLAVWNVNYDMPMILNVLERYGVPAEDVFSDPSVPEHLRLFKYKEGQKQRVTESGRVMAINPEQQWHVTYSTSSFTVIDAMAAYSYVRVGQAAVPGGYSLDNILKHNKVDAKLKFDDDPKYKGADWHKYMAKEKPLEYIIYNQWDTLGMIQLDLKTRDLSTSLPILAGVSDYDKFNSGPKKITDGLHFYYLANGIVLGTKPSRVKDNKLLGLDNWIITLPAYRLIDNGLCVIEEDGSMRTNMRAHVYDVDAVSSYPSDGIACNISKQTTKKEIVSIEGMTKDEFMYENINFFSGNVNSISYCSTMYNFPTLEELEGIVDAVI